jgi:2-aminoadipate transaminase
MSLERRHLLLQLADDLGIPVFEDDPYGRLRYTGEPLPNLKRIAGRSGLVAYASSFSKVLAPGVRVAWTMASPDIIRTMVLMRQGEDLCTSTVTQAMVAEYCRRGLLERHLTTILDVYSGKCRAMGRALEKHIPEGAAKWQAPRGGFFYWLRLPGLDSSQVFQRAVEEKVAFVPGTAFYPGEDEQAAPASSGTELARLAFTFANDAAIDEGCRRLGRVLGP